MNPFIRNVLLSTLLAAAASGSAFAKGDVTQGADPNYTECTSAPAAADTRGASDGREVAGNAKAKPQKRRFTSHYEWSPSNPFRDDTAG